MSFDLLMNVILLTFLLAIIWSMFHFHNNSHYKHFNLIDVITCHKGKVSRPALMEFGAFMVMTWTFVVLVNKEQLTEWFAGLYAAIFVARAAHSAYLGAKGSGK